MRTTYIAKEADIVKKWYVIDAEGVTLGRLASEVASILRGDAYAAPCNRGRQSE